MREKLVDIALIVTLIIVAFGITWTLLTLNRSQTRAPARERVETREAPRATEIAPLPLERTNERGRDDAGGGDQADERSTAREEASAREPDEARVPDSEPVPPGAVRLQRVGFSFVTGGAGACGVVLEEWRHIAVSRELLASYGCGAEVTIVLDDEAGGRRQFDAVIGDTMNPSFSRTVNVYVGEDEPALEYGLTTGVLRP